MRDGHLAGPACLHHALHSSQRGSAYPITQDMHATPAHVVVVADAQDLTCTAEMHNASICQPSIHIDNATLLHNSTHLCEEQILPAVPAAVPPPHQVLAAACAWQIDKQHVPAPAEHPAPAPAHPMLRSWPVPAADLHAAVQDCLQDYQHCSGPVPHCCCCACPASPRPAGCAPGLGQLLLRLLQLQQTLPSSRPLPASPAAGRWSAARPAPECATDLPPCVPGRPRWPEPAATTRKAQQ
ncbi:hypothetical protein COO60DRAFT_653511 [Scenedesmus sp. NREL 46B-D3]|nr:hypothetical protein COO60DRAFT_653511 [Scenedesmus sp. NREL 46B-D3]